MIEYSRFPSSEDPLSSDIFVIKTKVATYVFDTGASEQAVAFLNKIPDKTIIISHFHQDHSTNVKNIEFKTLYGGKKTVEYLKCGTAVDEQIDLEEGISIIPLTTTHAKGSLALKADDYLFVGDALCGAMLPAGYAYNANMLLSTIRELEKINARSIVISHSGKVVPRDYVISILKNCYSQRNGNNPYILTSFPEF